METTFRGEIDGETRFSLPSDRFGVGEMHSWIRDLRAGAAALVAVEPGVHRVTHGPGAKVEVAYTAAYDPRADGFVAFGPDVGPDHFHFFGSQWMAQVGPGEGPRDVEVLFRVEGWDGALGSSGSARVLSFQSDGSGLVGEWQYTDMSQPCRFRCGLKIQHADGTDIRCPKKKKWLGIIGDGIDRRRLEPGSDCWLWHGGDDVQWSGDPPPPSDGESESMDLFFMVDCGLTDLKIYTATSGNADPDTGEPISLWAMFFLWCMDQGDDRRWIGRVPRLGRESGAAWELAFRGFRAARVA